VLVSLGYLQVRSRSQVQVSGEDSCGNIIQLFGRGILGPSFTVQVLSSKGKKWGKRETFFSIKIHTGITKDSQFREI
jgi:hypothetical protein